MISLNFDALKELAKCAIKQQIADAIAKNNYTHENRDSYYSPAEWWVDEHSPENCGSRTRHSLNTGVELELDGDTLKVKLSYDVVDITGQRGISCHQT